MTRTWIVRCDEPECDQILVEGVVATGWVEFDGMHHCQEHATPEDMVMVIIESWRDPRKQAEQVLKYLRERVDLLPMLRPDGASDLSRFLARSSVMHALGGTDE